MVSEIVSIKGAEMQYTSLPSLLPLRKSLALNLTPYATQHSPDSVRWQGMLELINPVGARSGHHRAKHLRHGLGRAFAGENYLDK